MRVFVDACVDPRVVEGLAGQYVKTAFELGWHALADHELLPLISQRFDVVITIDQGFEFEHNLRKLSFGFVIVHVERNKVEFYRPLFPILKAIDGVKPGQVIHVRGM